MIRRNIILGIVGLAVLLATWWVARPTEPTAPAAESKPATAEASPGIIQLSPEQVRVAGLELATAGPGTDGELVFPGTVAAAPTSIARLDARASGTVRRVLKTLGDPVRRGETVAVIESAEASALAAQRAAAQARVTELSANYQREKRLFDANVTARQDLEAAQANLSVAEAELSRTRAALAAAGVTGDGRSVSVTSPLGGRITAAPVVLGSFVNAGEELFSVVDPSGLQVEVAIPAEQAAQIAPGDAASVALPGGGQVTARVRSITPSLDPESRSATAVLSLRGPALGLQPNAFVQVRITASRGQVSGGVSVPDEAVQTVGGRTVVFVRTDRGFRIQPVVVGRRANGEAAIESGLKAGQVVAAKNAFLLKAQLEKGAGDDE